ncbi:MAG: peptidoglycan DD-metalloendopeptidase family protein [Deltaproteobacteria bacterium]|nr:peptidoglycan DD-metalloendopeptidase family protein [Deltaproteobacteria bacterium]
MRNKISFLILNSTGSSVRNFNVSKTRLRIIGMGLAVCLLLMTFVVYDYFDLKKILVSKQQLEKKVVTQKDEIVSQRKQIQKFADEITTLKSNLVALHDFEKKIRIIANIEKPDDQGNLFGVGGSIPEDLDSRIPLTKKHNSLMREMHEQAEQLDLASINQQQGFESLFKYLEGQRNLLLSTPAVRPSKGWIASRFGYRKSPFTGLREFHKGLDIANRIGTPIISTAGGVVSFVGVKGNFGKTVKINHGHGMVTLYAHAHKVLKKQGDTVKRGDTIALMGNSGRSTGPHLHYVVFLNGIPVNPAKYILN